MKKQLRGIALLLFSILLMLGYGDEWLFDLDARWSMVFSVVGIAGVIMAFLPDRDDR